MPKFWLDMDELNPLYTLGPEPVPEWVIPGYPDTTLVEFTDEEVADFKRVFGEFLAWQEKLHDRFYGDEK